MEPPEAGKAGNLLAGLALTAVVLVLLVLWTCKGLHSARLSDSIRSDLPMLALELKFVDIHGTPVVPQPSRLGGTAAGDREKAPAAASERCAELIGGDTRERTTLGALEDRPADCPKTATWIVKRHPIAFSLYFQDAAALLALFEGDTPLHELFQTRLVQGIFYDPLHSASIRAEDLKLDGLQGAFLATLLREALQARGELHYDLAHGRKGFVFSFVREACPFAAKALPAAVRLLARNGYRLPTLTEPVVEMRIGLQRLFLTQYEDRVYFANGLEALLNVLESLPPPAQDLPKTPLVLTARAEALVDKLLPVMVGTPTWTLDLGLDFSREAPGVLRFAPGRFARQLTSKIFKGVLAGIPQDVFAAVATSFHLRPGMATADWQRLASQGPDEMAPGETTEAGVAILWDFNADYDPPSHMGVVIANQTSPDEVDDFRRYFTDRDLTASCGGGTVFLAATSRGLLTRMKEACERQSLSVLDWERGAKTETLQNAQLLLFMDPGAAMRELFLAGGAKRADAGEFEPEWKQQYEKAKEAMRTDSEKVFRGLPILAYAGSAPPTAPLVQLQGFTVRQGVSR